MATIITRETGTTAVNRALTNTELDNNFINLNTDIGTRILSSEKAAVNGVATLDATGKVPATQLPSYVDDVQEAANLAAFPATGETGKIYVALDTNKAYRWSGSVYVYITSGAVDSVAGRTGVVVLTKSDVGLANADNTADSSKNVLSATKWTTARTISITGDLSGSVSVDGTANASITGTLPATGVSAGSYGSATAIPVFTVDAKGRITAASTSAITVGNGALSLSISTGSTNTAVSVGTGTGFTANSSSAASYTMTVGPALVNLATLMTTAGAGFIRRGATADTYTIDTNTYLTAEADTLATVTARGATTSTAITLSNTLTINGGTGLRTFINGGSTITSHLYFANAANNIAYNWQLDENNNSALWGYGGAAWAKLLSVSSAGNLTTTGTIAASNFSGTSSGTNTGDNPGVTSVAGVTPIISSGGTTPSISHATSGVGAGTYNNVTVNTFGHVTAGSNTGYLTAESDTLATVTGRGASTSTRVTLSGGVTITSADIRSAATSTWTGDPGVEGKIQYHANRWYIVSDSSSDRIVQFRRNGGDVSHIDNSGNYNGNVIGNASTATTATTLQTSRTIDGTPFNGSANIDTTEWYHSGRDFPNGTLITTSIDYSVTNGDPFVLEIRGNSYGNIIPLDLLYQGYIYADSIINHGGISNGLNITGLVAINVGGKLCFWFPSQGYWNGYNVKAYTAYGTRATNKVTNITGEAKPASTKEVALSANIRQALHTSNYNSYSPTLTGGGASGTWGINITGSAGSVANAVTFTSSGGAAAGTTYNGSAARTIDYSTLGAAASGHNHQYNVNNDWLRDNNDDANVKLYGNSRQMAFRTDGTTEYATGVGGYPFAWMYGGDGAAQRLMLLNTTGDMWTSTNGWLSTALAGKQNTGSYLTTESDTLATVTARGASTTTLIQLSNQAVINVTTPGTANYGLHFTGQTTADYATGITWNGGTGTTGAQAGIYVQGSGNYGTKMYIATTDSYATGSKTAIAISEMGVANFLRARPQWNGTNLVIASDVVSSIAATSPIITSAATGAVTLSHAASGATAGTYNNVTVNTFGHVTGGSNAGYVTSSGVTSVATSGGYGGLTLTGGTITTTGTITMGGTPTGTWPISVTGNAATATNLSTGRTNWVTNGVGSAVVGMLGWKNYGNNHTIFDASASTAPDGTAISNSTPQNVWTGTYPTLMGWNGTNTYGVRVDVARYADSAGTSTDSTKVAKTGDTMSGPLNITGNGSYIGDWGYSTLILQDSGGYPGVNWRNGASNWLQRMQAGGAVMNWAYSSNASAQGVGGFTEYLTLSTSLLSHPSSMRAPIFYDLNDTAYYVDPNATTRIRKTNLVASGAGWDDGLNLYSSDATNRWNFLVDSGLSNSLRIAYNNSEALTINSSRNVTVAVDIRAPIFYDSNDTGYYGDFNGTSRVNLVKANSVYDWSTTRGVIPHGASYTTTSGNVTGAFKIKLPDGSRLLYPMLSFTVQLYNYDTGTSRSFRIGGHFSGTAWYNLFAYCLTDYAGSLNVRFGYDAANAMCVWIGELSTGWVYPQVFVTDFQNGYSAIQESWFTGWSITLVTAFDTVTNGPYTPAMGLNSKNYNSYSPTLTGTGASGTWGISITGNAATATTAGSVTGLTLTSSANGINPDNVTQNQIGYNTSVSLFGQTDGGLYSSAYSSSWIHQIYGDFRTGQIAIRGKNSGTWQAWRTVVDSSNVSSYAVTSLTDTLATVTGRGNVASASIGVPAGDGIGYSFWGTGSSYKISMGVGSLYQYGTVTDYSIKMQMDTGSTGRGFTWGRDGVTPVAGLNSTSGNFQTAGTITAGGNITAFSDIRLKTDLEIIPDALSKVKQLTGYTYTRTDSNQRQTGLVAQDVQKVLPEAVVDGEYLSLAYGNLVGLLVEAIKEQQTIIDSQESRITRLEALVSKLIEG